MFVRAAALGLLFGVLAVPALLFGGQPSVEANTIAFSLGALLFGFSVTVWAGTAMLGTTFEVAYSYLAPDGDWTAADTRQAMALITVFGASVMVGSVVGATLVSAAGYP
ncbi:hypothetical protein ACFQH6_02290 [Halobacteriaceae archaeon GCM10025711]